MADFLETSSSPMDDSTIILDLQVVGALIEDEYQNSKEADFWRRRSSSAYKKAESYRSFKSCRITDRKKRHCMDKMSFKRPKRWYGYEEKYMDYHAYCYLTYNEREQTTHRNRVFCPCCNKNKTLFESEKKADNFIKFNSLKILELNGYAPVRSYYCNLCGGWHVTSIEEPSESSGFSRAEIILRKNQAKGDDVMSMEQSIEDGVAEEKALKDLISEIKVCFNQEMEKFFDSYRGKDLKECKKILSNLKKLFKDIDSDNKEILKMKKRLTDADVNINKLTAELAEAEENKRNVIFGIQQIFKAEFDRFNRLYALKKLDECYKIYNKVSCINEYTELGVSSLKALSKKLDIMKERLMTLEEIMSKFDSLNAARDERDVPIQAILSQAICGISWDN